METPGVGLDILGLNESEEESVAKSIDTGYAMVDIGENYGNLALVGALLKKCSRKPYLIVKLSGMPSGEYEEVRERLGKILSQLDVPLVDLCLIQWPGLCTWDVTDKSPLASSAAFQGKTSSWPVFNENIAAAWSNMVKLKEDGLCAEIGTSNFYPEHLQVLKKCSRAVPFANEIFVNATNPEFDFVTDMQAQGIRVIAYKPVASKPYPEQVNTVATRVRETVKNVSMESVILAWLLKRGIWPLVHCECDNVIENPSLPMEVKDQLTEVDFLEFRRAELGLHFSREWFAKIWRNHSMPIKYTEEDVQKLVKKGVNEEKARSMLVQTAGDVKMAAFYLNC